MKKNKNNINIAILAAGKGTRMKSEHPKVLHPICGKPMIRYILETIKGLTVKNIFMIIGHQKEILLKTLSEQVTPVIQDKQLGTGHAINQLETYFKDQNGTLIVLCADTPFISVKTLKGLLKQHHNSRSSATVLTCRIKNPAGYGRIVKKNGEILKIVEELDADPDEKNIDEINSGIYCFETDALFKALKNVQTNNKKKEYYLTDVIAILHSKGLKTSSFLITNEDEIRGINTKVDLAWAEKYKRKEILNKLMLSGITIIDPDTTFISENTRIGADTVIYPFSIIEGENIIGKNCSLGPQIKIKNCKIGNESEIFFSVINESVIKDKIRIGPFTNIRPQTVVNNEAHLGSFVEVKKSFIGKKTKIGHLSYLGDSIIGNEVNIGAGTITCNYDGIKKYQTIIENDAFIGSDSQLVAPVKVGKGALIGAGSTITKNVPAFSLSLSRMKQINIENGANKKFKNKKQENT
ncbi:MAG: bifunctional UDP-N-acetylglucosamine diphosphorylase/glucosamine-1-phosphate N-acetyltransferase GlmU [bacterium]|nr:bifunctional UDP-N-acetylglucosamine diphosphorylase/glucosamine-1-phosphate N-acetyltransferase GlmU [bacterium]